MSGASKDSPRAQILVVEDSSVFREMQGLLLGQAGFAVSAHENPHAALAAAGRQRFDLVVIDYELPEMNGHQFMHALRAIQPDIAVIFVSGSLTLELAIQLSNEGVAGIFNKPANPKHLLEKINETLFRHARGSASPLPIARRETNGGAGASVYTPPEPAADQLAYVPQFVLGASEPFREFTHRLWKVRDFRSVLLLQGEEGSAFELFARELAGISTFRDGPVMLCGLEQFEPRRLIEVLAPSLLSQDAGTLIVTGVERFTAAQQKTLENLLSGRDVFLPFARRFRVILAATTELNSRVDAGTFDETLFYKVSALSLTLPALRQMPADLPENAARILAQLNAGGLTRAVTLHPDVAQWLTEQDWPGNYAQLEDVLRVAAPQARGSQLDMDALAAACDPVEDDSVAAAVAIERPEPEPAPASSLSARSLFRPTSAAYPFAERLADALAAADALPVH